MIFLIKEWAAKTVFPVSVWFVATLGLQSFADSPFQSPRLTLEPGGTLSGWSLQSPDKMSIQATPGGVEVSVNSVGKSFNDLGFMTAKLPIPKGHYLLSFTLSGDEGAKVFVGLRLSVPPAAKDTGGPDLWENAGAAAKKIQGRYVVNEEGTFRIIIGLGFKENAGKKIILQNFSLVPVEPEAPKTGVRTGAGTEYDNLIITNDVDDGSKPAILPVVITVDETKKIRPAGKRLLGLVNDANPLDDMFLNSERTEVSAEMNALLKTVPMPVNRMIRYNETSPWKYSVGPREERKPTRVWPWEKPTIAAMGPAEHLSAILKNDPSATFIWTVNVTHDSAEDAADVAEFLTGDGVQKRGATNWAKYRIDAGVKGPVTILTYELGNEVEWKAVSNRMSIRDYVDRCKKIIQAIRQVDPKATFSPHAATAPWGYGRYAGEDWRDWHRTILRELGPEISHLAFHPYYYGYPTSVLEPYFDTITADVKTITGSDRIKLYISEHGLWPAQKEGVKWETTWYTTHALMGCLATAQFLNRLYDREDVSLATYHALNAGPWGFIYRGKQTKKLYPTALVDLFRIYNESVGDHVLGLSVAGGYTDVKKDDLSLTALATDRDQGLTLILVNREKTMKRAAEFKFQGRYDLVRTSILTGPSVHAYNDENEKRVSVSESTAVVRDFNRFEVPAKSVVVLYLNKK